MRVVEKRVALSLAIAAVFAALSTTAASASAAEILSVKNESANFRDGPGDKHAIVYSADKFYPVEVVEKKDGWAKVKDFEGDVAWVAERLLTKQETVVVEGDKVNVREKPNTTSEIAFKSERGEVFKVEQHQGKWLKVVDANGDGGWIRDDMVWGEKLAAADAPKGKTKGEIEEPGAKPGATPVPVPGDKVDKGDKAKGAKPDKGDKTADKGGDKAAPKPKGDKADKGDKPEAKPKDGKEGKPGSEKAKSAEKPADKADAPAEKGDARAEEKSDEKSDDAKGDGDAKSDEKSDGAEEKGDEAEADEKSGDAG